MDGSNRRTAISTRSFSTLVASSIALVMFLPGCSDDITSPDATPLVSERLLTKIDTSLTNLPSWSEFSPEMEPFDGAIGDKETLPVEVVGNVGYECTTTPFNLTDTPDKIVTFDPDANILWVGGLLQGKGYKEGIGSLAELAIRERAPLTIAIDILARNNTRTVRDPTLASVNQAIGELIERASDADLRAGSSISFAQENTHSVDQAALAMGLSAGYMSASVKASLSAKRSAAERSVTAYFVQKMFTASIVLPSRPSDLFSREFTQARLDDEFKRGTIGSDNIPVYIANVVYGRLLKFSFTSTASLREIRAALSASFGSVASGELSAEFKKLLQESRINVVTVGGDGKNALALIQGGQLRDYFAENAPLTSARPISYTVRNLGDNSIAKVSETTDYNIKECTAIPATGTLEIDVTPNNASVMVTGPNGFNHGPSTGDQVLTELMPGGYHIAVTVGQNTKEVDRDVFAGDTTRVEVEFGDPVAAVYTVFFRDFSLDAIPNACSVDAPDVYYSLNVENVLVASLPREDAIADRPVGAIVNVGTTSPEVQINRNASLRISGKIEDSDPIGSDDVLANFVRLLAPGSDGLIPTKEHHLQVGAGDCRVTLNIRVTQVGKVLGIPRWIVDGAAETG